MRRGIQFLAFLTVTVISVHNPAVGQPLTDRSPNMDGTWVTPPHNLFFQFSHRFEMAGTDADIGDIFGEGSHYAGVLEGGLQVISLGDMCLPGADEGPQGARFLPKERRGVGVTSMGCWMCDCAICCSDPPFRLADGFRGPLDSPIRD